METQRLEQPEKAARSSRPPGRTRQKTIRFVKSVAGARFSYYPGQIVELPTALANEMIASGYAEAE